MSVPFEIKGWCPGALRPMASGDGLVVRVRPRAGTLTSAEALAIATGARLYGNGLIDLTSRANLQIRGVSEKTHRPLIEHLSLAGLIDDDVESECRRNIIVTPFGTGDCRTQTISIASSLEAALAGAPSLPGKFGFAVDTGNRRVLADTSADIRIERDVSGEIIVRADGAPAGCRVAADEAADMALQLVHWFVESGGVNCGRGRMAEHLAQGAQLTAQLTGTAKPAPAQLPSRPGATSSGVLVGAEFGQFQAEMIEALAACCSELRVTPWRMLLLAGTSKAPDINGLITAPDDPRVRVTACTGAPGCPQARAPVRDLARRLAPFVPAHSHLHVTGCAKGCAMPRAAPFTLLATPQGFSQILNGSARAEPARTGLAADTIAANPLLVFELA